MWNLRHFSFCILFSIIHANSLYVFAQSNVTSEGDSTTSDSINTDTPTTDSTPSEDQAISGKQLSTPEQYSEEIASVTEFSLASPQQTVGSHLLFLQPESYNTTLSAQTLQAEKLIGGRYSESELIELAIKLKEIYDGSGLYIDLSDIPNDPNYKDSVDQRNLFRIYPRKFPMIFLVKQNGQWVYSKETVANIDQLHAKVFPLGSDVLRRFLPSALRKSILGLEIWQYFGLVILAFLGYLLYRVVSKISNYVIRKIIPLVGNQTSLTTQDVGPLANSASLLLVLTLVSILVPTLQLPVQLTSYISLGFKIFIPTVVIVILFKTIDLVAIVSRNLASQTDTTMDDQLIPLMKKLIKFVIGSFGTIFILGNVGVDVTALLAGVSIGGLAIALAAQDTVKNLIGSLTIFIDQPFKIGEFIVTDKVTGSVEEVGIRSTRIRALDGALVSIPNGELANLTVTNHSIRSYRRYSTDLTVTYNTSPNQMETFVEEVRRIINEHPKTRSSGTTVHFYEMGDSALKIFIAIISELTDYGEWLSARQDIFLGIMRKAEEMGISFAFPSTSVYLESIPENINSGPLNGVES